MMERTMSGAASGSTFYGNSLNKLNYIAPTLGRKCKRELLMPG
jgi:hypothetical protein